MSRRIPRRTRVQKVGHFVKTHWWLFAGVLVAVAAMGVAASFLGNVPLPETAPGAQSSKILAFDGKLIGTLHGEENRSIVPLDQISTNLQKAVIAAEDRGFFEHPGVSLKGILRAAFANVRGGGVQQGGSTITQQYVRNAFAQVGRERTIFRKVKEVTLAVKTERKYSKDKILEFYLNTVYFGRGAYGAEAAAQTYFKKPAKDLTVGQAAYLAGIIRSPERFQIDRAKQDAERIRSVVIADMLGSGFIDQAQAEQAKREDLAADFKPGQSVEADSPRAAYFVEYVRRRLRDEFRLTDKQILGGGLTVKTTLDLRMQIAAESAISSTLDKDNDPEAGLVAMDPQGMVRAMVGGRNVTDVKRARGTNWAANVRSDDQGGRQAGSAFKPFALAAFVDEDKSVNSQFPGPTEIKIDSRRCRNADGTAWEVSNFENESFGAIDVISATTKSVNTIYAQIMDKVVTPSKFVAMADKAGISIPRNDVGCALTLGTADVTPFGMARAYTTFAARGKRPDPLTILQIIAPDGKMIAERQPRIERTIDENVADTVNHVLNQNIKRGTGTGAAIGRPAAGKTGTTQNHRDAWFAGYTPELTAVVWMGYAPKTKGGIPDEMLNVHGKKVTGGSFPATIWRRFMSEALKGVKGTDFSKPDLGGEVINVAPQPCKAVSPSESPSPAPSRDPNCIPVATPSPSPSPEPSISIDVSLPPSPSIPVVPSPSLPVIPPIGGNIGPDSGLPGDTGKNG
ncbi:MAG: transglycosylase domain-containing protein [Actinomycetota bacterium]